MKRKRTTLDEYLDEMEDEIVIPNIKYRRVPYINGINIYKGDVIPIPCVLMEYLTYSEVRVLYVILSTIKKTGNCFLRCITIAKMLGLTQQSVNITLKNMKSMGIIKINGNKKMTKEIIINFDMINKLAEFVDGYNPGALAALRKKAKIKSFESFNLSDKEMLDEKFLDHDEEEYEEYN